MSQILYDDGFFDDLTRVASSKMEERIFHAIDLLPAVPVLSSTNLPASIAQIYGNHVRKLPVGPFDVIYEILDDGDFLVLGIIHQRAAR